MITEDINCAIDMSVIPVDVVLMDDQTYQDLYKETVSLLYNDRPIEQFLKRQIPDSMTIRGIKVQVSDKVKGFTLI